MPRSRLLYTILPVAVCLVTLVLLRVRGGLCVLEPKVIIYKGIAVTTQRYYQMYITYKLYVSSNAGYRFG